MNWAELIKEHEADTKERRVISMKNAVTIERDKLARMILFAAYTTNEILRNTELDDPKYESRKKERDFFWDLDGAILENNWDEIICKLGPCVDEIGEID